jgi:hypothetical protein
MSKLQILPKLIRPYSCMVFVILLFVFLGCSANYGRIRRDPAIQQAFEINQVSADYKYYYYGFKSRPYAIIGIIPKYEAGTKLWFEAQANTEEFKEMVRWIWEDYGYYKFGAHILDPDGNQIGVYYSSIREVGIKFTGENRIMVIPNTPFLGGPDGRRSP